MPWVRWPPCGSDMARMVSPGWQNAPYTAWLALAPECGWRLAWSASKSRLARSMPIDSALSTSEQPP